MQNVYKYSAFLLCLFMLVLAITGCNKKNQIPANGSNTAESVAQTLDFAASLSSEFQNFDAQSLPDDYIDSRRIAKEVVSYLIHDKIADACLLMAASSFRQIQSAKRAYLLGVRGMGDLTDSESLSEADRNKLLELDRMWEFVEKQNYDQEITVCADILSGKKQITYLMGQAINRTDKGASSFESIKAKLKIYVEKMVNVGQVTELKPQNISLLNSFKARLLTSLTDEHLRSSAAKYLATTPFSEFQQALLNNANEYFEVQLIKNSPIRNHKKTVAALGHKNAKTRSNAAIWLGKNLVEAAISPLREAIGKEQDPFVKLSMDFALLNFGVTKSLEDLLVAAKKPAEKSKASNSKALRNHALLLLRWLPQSLINKLEQEFMFSIINSDESFENKLLATELLADFLSANDLDEQYLPRLMALANGKDQLLAHASFGVIENIRQLDSYALTKMLEKENKPALITALFMRWASIASSDDLELLQKYYHAYNWPEARKYLLAAILRVADDRAITAFGGFLKEVGASEQQLLLESINHEVIARLSDDNQARLLGFLQGINSPEALFIRLLIADKVEMEHETELSIMLKSKDFETRIKAIKLIGQYKILSLIEELWLIGNSQNKSSLQEIAIRRMALSSVMQYELDRFVLREIAEP